MNAPTPAPVVTEEIIERALGDHFRSVIADHAGMPFEQTGVAFPAASIKKSAAAVFAALAATLALRTPAATTGEEPVAWEWIRPDGERERIGAFDIAVQQASLGWTSRALYAAPPADARREALEKALRPLAQLPVGPEVEDDLDLVLYRNADRSITVGDVLTARRALAEARR